MVGHCIYIQSDKGNDHQQYISKKTEYSAGHTNTSNKNWPTLKPIKKILCACLKKLETIFDSFWLVLQSIV